MDLDSGEATPVSHVLAVRDGTNSTDLSVSTNGSYRLVWDACADLGEVVRSNLVVRVKGRGKVQLWAGGPYWATTNVGAEEPWDYGLYFWWGDTVGYRREGDAWVASDGSSQNFQFSGDPISQQTSGKSTATLQNEGWTTSAGVLAPAHDAAQVHWGGGWRMPTYQELYDLCYTYCDWTWTTTNGVNGYVVRGRAAFAGAALCGNALSPDSTIRTRQTTSSQSSRW